VDPPFGLSVAEIIAWQNGTHPLNTVRFDSDFGALYWPWVKIHDNANNVDVWVPPSGSVIATIAYSDSVSYPWFAPAGMTRGIVPGVTDVFTRPTRTERDAMYGNQNCINPIIQFVDVAGFLIWGQKTLQRLPSALDRVNVRRLMFYCEREISSAVRVLLFEPNDATFVQRFETIVTGILNAVQVAQGLTQYIIDDGPDLNTPDIVAQNEFRAQIGIQPTLAVEFIFLEFSVQRQGDITQADLGTF
jgi:phage tail sheath protein FI